jgi:hypothetical protein
MADTNTKVDYAAQIAAMKQEKMERAEKIAALKKAAKAAGMEVASDKTRLTPDEVIRTFAKSTVVSFVRDVLSTNTDALNKAKSELAEAEGFLKTSPDSVPAQRLVEFAKRAVNDIEQRSVNVDASRVQSMRKLVIALCKAEKLDGLAIATLLRPLTMEGVNVLPAVGFKKVK